MATVIEPNTRSFDLVRARRELDEQGYTVVPGVLDPDQIAALKQRLQDQAAGERAAGVATRDGGGDQPNQRIWMLLNKGRVFRDLMLMPIIDQLMSHLLGPDYLLSSLTANIAHRGGQPMMLHTDQGYIGFWTPRPAVANIAWMLDDFTDANGGTRLVPGSHLTERAAPDNGTPFIGADDTRKLPTQADTIAGEGEAGSILCFDGRIWHGTGANRTDGARHALLSYHCRPWVRQQENAILGLDPAIRAGERPELLDRLGWKVWAGLGRVESPMPQGRLSEATGAIPELAADGTPV